MYVADYARVADYFVRWGQGVFHKGLQNKALIGSTGKRPGAEEAV